MTARSILRCVTCGLISTAAIAPLACGDDAEATFATVEVTELNLLCIEPAGAAGELEADATARVRVQFNTCLSSSCDRLLDASCDVQLDNTSITVSGSALVESRFDPDTGCSSDCGLVTATCEVDLPAGEYELTGSGVSAQTVTVPGAAPTCEIL